MLRGLPAVSEFGDEQGNIFRILRITNIRTVQGRDFFLVRRSSGPHKNVPEKFEVILYCSKGHDVVIFRNDQASFQDVSDGPVLRLEVAYFALVILPTVGAWTGSDENPVVGVVLPYPNFSLFYRGACFGKLLVVIQVRPTKKLEHVFFHRRRGLDVVGKLVEACFIEALAQALLQSGEPKRDVLSIRIYDFVLEIDEVVGLVTNLSIQRSLILDSSFLDNLGEQRSKLIFKLLDLLIPGGLVWISLCHVNFFASLFRNGYCFNELHGSSLTQQPNQPRLVCRLEGSEVIDP